MSAQNLIEEARKRAASSIPMGALSAALGAFLISYPLATAKVTTVLLGGILIFAAVAQLVLGLHSEKPGSFFRKLLGAAMFGITGFALAFAPMAGVEALTGLLGTLLLFQAGLATATGFQIRPLEGWGWFLAGCHNQLRVRPVDSRQVAVQLCFGNWRAGRSLRTNGRRGQNHDRREDSERR